MNRFREIVALPFFILGGIINIVGALIAGDDLDFPFYEE